MAGFRLAGITGSTGVRLAIGLIAVWKTSSLPGCRAQGLSGKDIRLSLGLPRPNAVAMATLPPPPSRPGGQ